MSWFNNHQTIIVGVIGFAGVIVTMWYNAKVARDRRDDELAADRKALRTAFLAELQINLTAMKESSRGLREKPPEGGGGAFVPTDRMDHAYRSFLPKIGLLSETEVSKVMGAYLALETYTAKLFLVGTPVHTSDRHVNVPAKNAPLLAGMQESMVKPLESAIAALKEHEDMR